MSGRIRGRGSRRGQGRMRGRRRGRGRGQSSGHGGQSGRPQVRILSNIIPGFTAGGCSESTNTPINERPSKFCQINEEDTSETPKISSREHPSAASGNSANSESLTSPSIR